MGIDLGFYLTDSLLIWAVWCTVFPLFYLQALPARLRTPIAPRPAAVLIGALAFATGLVLLAWIRQWRTEIGIPPAALALFWVTGFIVGVCGCAVSLRLAAGGGGGRVTGGTMARTVAGFWLGSLGGYLLSAAVLLVGVLIVGSR